MTRLATAPRPLAASSPDSVQEGPIGAEPTRPPTTRAELTRRPDDGARPAGRAVHPWAWWAWALGAATAASLTTNPLAIALLVAGVVFVVIQRRGTAPWARSVRAYFILAGVVIGIRLTFQIFVGGMRDGIVLFTLPEIGLPRWAAGIRLGGPVTLDGVLFATYDAARLGAMLICVGAANALANPKRALRAVPAAFHQVSTALVIALTVAPQLVESAQRVHRARRLRGRPERGIRGALSLVVPVLEDAIERSMGLAAGMESRGYGRTRDDRRVGAGTSVVLLAAMAGLLMGVFGWLSGFQRTASVLVTAASLAAGWWGLRESGRRLRVSRYRPDPWGWPEWIVCACGLGALAAIGWLAASSPDLLQPSTFPTEWPQLHPLMLVAVALVAAPGVVTPIPPKSA